METIVLSKKNINKKEKSLSSIGLINESCANQNVDAVMNAANKNLMAGGRFGGIVKALKRNAAT